MGGNIKGKRKLLAWYPTCCFWVEVVRWICSGTVRRALPVTLRALRVADGRRKEGFLLYGAIYESHGKEFLVFHWLRYLFTSNVILSNNNTKIISTHLYLISNYCATD